MSISKVNSISYDRKVFAGKEKDALMFMTIKQLTELKQHVQHVITFKRTTARFKHCKMCFAINNPWRKTCRECKSDNLR